MEEARPYKGLLMLLTRSLRTLLLLLALWPVVASAAPALLNPGQSQPVTPFEILEAPDNEANPSNLLQPYWQQQFMPASNKPLVDADSILWLKITVRNPLPAPAIWWLDAWPTAISQLHAYRQNGDVLEDIGPHGPAHSLPLIVPPGDSTVYLHLVSSLRQSLVLHWLPEARTADTLNQRLWLSGTALGALLLLSLITGGFSFLYRDACYGALSIYLLGLDIWLWPIWAANDQHGLQVSSLGLLIATFALPGLVYTLDPQRTLKRTSLRMSAIAFLMVSALWLLWLLPPASGSLLALTAYAGASAFFIAHTSRLSISGVRGTLALAWLQGLPFAVLASLWMAADNSLQAFFTPSVLVLLTFLANGTGMLLALFLRTKHRWLDYEARQRVLAGMEGETRSRGDILSRISHEIRTPMSGILGMAELLQETPLTPEQRDFVETIQSSGHSLLNLIGEVMDDSALASEGATANEAPFQPEALILEVVNGFRNLAEQRQVELICDLPDTLPAVVIGDPVRMRQVLLHVLGRAIRQSSRSDVSLAVHCRLANRRASLDFSIRDTGPRMSSEALAEASGQGRQESPMASSAGLDIARRLTGMMGGKFHIDSDRLAGTTVSFSLDLPMELETESPAMHDTAALADRRLLIVDDSEALTRTLLHQVARWGMQAESARSGSEALGQVRNRVAMGLPYDVILLDYRLPGINGLELARRIQQVQEPPPRILMLTGLRHFPSQAECQAAGIHRLLTKPATGTALRLAFCDALGQDPANHTLPNNQRHSESLRILLAEDNPVTARVIEAMLKKLGAHSERAENGLQALEACQRAYYDLVLMDCEMPVMDGYTATQRIREWEQETGRTPTLIYALTSHILNEYREKSRLAGMDGHLGKPVDLSELATTLQRCKADA